MRILARLHLYPPTHNAGGEWMAHSLLKALVDRGHDVEVWLSRYSSQRTLYEIDGVRVIPQAARLDYGAAAKTADVIVSHLESVPSAAALARGWGKPFVTLCHNTFVPTFRQMASGTTALAVYNSQWMAREAELFFTEYPKSVRPANEIVVRPPVFADDYRATPGDCITLINLYGNKGGSVLWDLAERMPDHQFLGVLGAYGEQVIRSARNVEVVDHVPGPEMATQVYARTRTLIMPSVYESWGRTGVEAMASGIPVVATPTPGLCESLADAGIYCERSDLDAWGAALTALDDPAEWQAASERALLRSKELDPTEDLARWCDAIEALS